MQTGLKLMDGTSSMAYVLSQRGRAKQEQPSPTSWASPEAFKDQVWLEELLGPSYNQSFLSQPSCPSAPNSSPGGSSDGTGSLYSWSSGVTCLLHSSIKKQSQEAFQNRMRKERSWGKLARCPSSGSHPQVEQGGGNHNNQHHAWPERDGLCQGRGSAQSAESVKLQCLLEEKIVAKVKFSQFLDEVTSNVLDPNSLQVFGKPVLPSSFTTTTPPESEDEIKEATQWSPRLPCSMAQQQCSLYEQEKTQEGQAPFDPAQKTYLETDIDAVRWGDEPQDLEIKAETPPLPEIDEKNVIPPPPQFCEGFEIKSPFLEFHGDFPRYPHRSASLPRGINMVSDESHPSL